MAALVEGTGLVDMPGIEGRIGRDVDGELSHHCHHLTKERMVVGDIVLVEGLRGLGQDDIAILWGGGGDDPAPIAPEALFLFCMGLLGLRRTITWG